MSKVVRLREALKQIEVRGARVASQAADDGIGTDLSIVLAAARRFLALTETGQRIRWCEAHHAPEAGNDGACVLAVYSMSFAVADCEIVLKFLADYKETE